MNLKFLVYLLLRITKIHIAIIYYHIYHLLNWIFIFYRNYLVCFFILLMLLCAKVIDIWLRILAYYIIKLILSSYYHSSIYQFQLISFITIIHLKFSSIPLTFWIPFLFIFNISCLHFKPIIHHILDRLLCFYIYFPVLHPFSLAIYL